MAGYLCAFKWSTNYFPKSNDDDESKIYKKLKQRTSMRDKFLLECHHEPGLCLETITMLGSSYPLCGVMQLCTCLFAAPMTSKRDKSADVSTKAGASEHPPRVLLDHLDA